MAWILGSRCHDRLDVEFGGGVVILEVQVFCWTRIAAAGAAPIWFRRVTAPRNILV